jgi:glucokinase
MSDTNATWLIADVGATSSRCAVVTSGRYGDVSIFRNNDMTSLEALLSEYIENSTVQPTHCALAVAAPISGDHVRMSNRDWSFSVQSVRALGLDRVEIINDFHAIAYALPYFDDRTRMEIGSAAQYRDGNIAVLGPGSGLGMAAWIGDAAPMTGEGGHITVPGRNEYEDNIIAKLRDAYGHCSAERILSGPGLSALHEAIHGKAPASSESITGNPGDEQNRQTLQQFFRFLASVAADLALITGAYGGIYIAGGIVPACIEHMDPSDFRARFEDKNRYTDYMRGIPTWVITDPFPGLTGLNAYIKRL